MSIREKLQNAKQGTDWLTQGFSKVELKQNKDLALISASIESKRINLGLSQKEFANLLGVSQGMVSRYESGEYNFSIETLNELCSKIGLIFDPIVYDPEKTANNIKIIKCGSFIDKPANIDSSKLEAIA